MESENRSGIEDARPLALLKGSLGDTPNLRMAKAMTWPLSMRFLNTTGRYSSLSCSVYPLWWTILIGVMTVDVSDPSKPTPEVRTQITNAYTVKLTKQQDFAFILVPLRILFDLFINFQRLFRSVAVDGRDAVCHLCPPGLEVLFDALWVVLWLCVTARQ